jgi:hypothetical protein
MQQETKQTLTPLERQCMFTPILPLEKLMQRITRNTTLSGVAYILKTFGNFPHNGFKTIHLKQRHKTRLQYMKLTSMLLEKVGATIYCIPLTQPSGNNNHGFNIYICQKGALVVPRKGNTSEVVASYSTTHAASQVSECLIIGVK